MFFQFLISNVYFYQDSLFFLRDFFTRISKTSLTNLEIDTDSLPRDSTPAPTSGQIKAPVMNISGRSSTPEDPEQTVVFDEIEDELYGENFVKSTLSEDVVSEDQPIYIKSVYKDSIEILKQMLQNL